MSETKCARRWPAILFLAVAAVLAFGSPVAAQTDVTTSRVSGTIRGEDRNPLPGVNVEAKNQETGLAKIEACLKQHDLVGAVHDPGTPLTEAVNEALSVVPK